MQLSTPHLLGIRDLQPGDIQLILDTATQFKEVLQRPIKKVPTLRDVTIVNLFYENSTRTRISFELAEKRLSADTINFTASGSSAAKGETLLDTVNNILSMKVDMVVMRHSASGAPHFLALPDQLAGRKQGLAMIYGQIQLQSAMLALNYIYRMLLTIGVTVMPLVLIAWIWQSRKAVRPAHHIAAPAH